MAEPDLRPVNAVCDAGPIIHLDELGCLELLADFPLILVPDAVWREVEHHRPAALRYPDIRFERAAIDSSIDPEINVLSELYTLDAGETEALKILRQATTHMFLTDDTAARLAAQGLGIEVHGTIGIVIRAIRRDLKTTSEVVAILESIPRKSTLFIKPSLLKEIIEQVALLA